MRSSTTGAGAPVGGREGRRGTRGRRRRRRRGRRRSTGRGRRPPPGRGRRRRAPAAGGPGPGRCPGTRRRAPPPGRGARPRAARRPARAARPPTAPDRRGRAPRPWGRGRSGRRSRPGSRPAATHSGRPALPAQGGQGGGVDPALLRPQQQVAQLLPEPAQRQRGTQRLGPARRTVLEVAGEQAADLEVLLRPGQQPQGRAVGPAQLAAQQRVGVAVEGHGDRAAGGAAEPGGDPLAQLLRRPAAEGQDQDLLGREPAPLDPVDDRLDQRRRLAGARPGEHQQRPARVLDDAPLVGVQDRWSPRPGGAAAQGAPVVAADVAVGLSGTATVQHHPPTGTAARPRPAVRDAASDGRACA